MRTQTYIFQKAVEKTEYKSRCILLTGGRQDERQNPITESH